MLLSLIPFYIPKKIKAQKGNYAKFTPAQACLAQTEGHECLGAEHNAEKRRRIQGPRWLCYVTYMVPAGPVMCVSPIGLCLSSKSRLTGTFCINLTAKEL